MATVTWYEGLGAYAHFYLMWYGDLTLKNSTGERAVFAADNGVRMVLVGEDLAFDGSDATAGTVTAVRFFTRDGDPIIAFEDLSLSAVEMQRGIETLGWFSGFVEEVLKGDDTIIGSANGEQIYGTAGNDLIGGGGGNDVIYGYSGAEMMFGGLGADQLYGGAGRDTIYGEHGADTLVGSKGRDILIGGLGSDAVSGAAGRDVVKGGPGDDLLYGGGARDILLGNGGGDAVFGQKGIDEAYGGRGNDFLFGGQDTDLLAGGRGRDTLAGGAGADVFQFARVAWSPADKTGRDVITDFNRRHFDIIDLSPIDADRTTSGHQPFAFVGEAAFSGTAGELRYRQKGNGDTLVLGDVDGDGEADLAIRLQNFQAELTTADFILSF
ncbi:hypothetical protein LXM94_01380 [Rhizobium sp. TRM95111]|uniref:calcium-binding protein n=1 Tax=Rhizobium alarense TaxID=2846851 RepID=UPI001F481265|nr:calcium-binding protein [Rhizobium alarense]MCF3638621.1 hypothetical protein [Rhizobium alarense]